MKRAKKEFDPKQVEKLAGFGLTQEQIADWFGVSDRTLRNRLSEDDDLVSAYKTGRAKRLADVTEKLADLIDKGDRAAIFFYLKTQAGWKETDIHEVAGKDGGAIEVVVRRTVVRPDAED